MTFKQKDFWPTGLESFRPLGWLFVGLTVAYALLCAAVYFGLI